jgi:ribonuclease HII
MIEIGIDEVGRGPLFGRVYAAAVILPKDMDTSKIKDSKKFSSAKKREEVAKYIEENAVAWSVQYEDETTIDKINILQATQNAMHKCIHDLMKRVPYSHEDVVLLVDGNYFRPFTMFHAEKKRIEEVKYQCVIEGDALHPCISAASILAKVARDKYIDDLCDEYPELQEKYQLKSNKGYGSVKHREGIRQHGISQWHRKTFGICKGF